MVRVGVIGLGYWGPNLVRNLRDVAGEGLVACADLDPARVKTVGARYPGVEFTTDVDALIARRDLDAVAIATPVATHHPLAKRALEAGKSVFVEKPMTASVEHARELIELADARGLVLMVDHVFLFSPAVRKMKEIVDSGQLGKLLYIDGVRINLGLFQHDVNVVWDLAPHDLSIFDFLVGRGPVSVSAFGAGHVTQSIEDVAYLTLDYGDGLIANLHVNWLSPVKVRRTMVGGSAKSLVYNDIDLVERIKVYDAGLAVRSADVEDRRRVLIDYRSGDVWSPQIGTGEPLRDVVKHFLDCVAAKSRPLTDGRAGLRIVRILDAAQRSIKKGGERIALAE